MTSTPRLTAEREREIRNDFDMAMRLRLAQGAELTYTERMCRDLLDEIDALRECRANICRHAGVMFDFLPEARQAEFALVCRNTPGPCFCGCHTSEPMISP